ncbi:SAF domain-containing protein [Actinomadura sp. WMMB 499]|uniref:SAF domain-containing protein n=1 Tax=Actinomadura sp. WMMB 499 TaxID=1219491 RepID=UPI001243AEFA|nr:SAF domain-containing protein [Actinomadura sp. WMMB 499]QFG21594.1 flagellar biosynthesis protein FlgA [Actinomadura sp. WMMB 499]
MTRLTGLRRPLATLFAAAAAWLALLTLRPGPPATVRVLAAARDLPAGATLAASDVRPVSLPPGAVPSGALRADAAGRVLAGPMRRGEPLTDVRVIGDRLLRGFGPDKVATPIRIADAGTVRLVRPGDRIDVLAAPHPGEAPMAAPPAGIDRPPTGAPHPARHSPPVATSRDSPRPLSGTRDSPAPAPVSHRPGPLPPPSTRTAARPTGTPWDGARVVVSSVPVIAVPSPEDEGPRDGALIVLATTRGQALALAGSRTDLAVTITT